MRHLKPKVKRLSDTQAELLIRAYRETVNVSSANGNTSKAVKALVDAGLVRRLYDGVLVVTPAGEARLANMKTRNRRERDGS